MKRFVIRIDCRPTVEAGMQCSIELRILDGETRQPIAGVDVVPLRLGDGAEIVTECCPAESAEEITRRFALELSASGG